MRTRARMPQRRAATSCSRNGRSRCCGEVLGAGPRTGAGVRGGRTWPPSSPPATGPRRRGRGVKSDQFALERGRLKVCPGYAGAMLLTQPLHQPHAVIVLRLQLEASCRVCQSLLRLSHLNIKPCEAGTVCGVQLGPMSH